MKSLRLVLLMWTLAICGWCSAEVPASLTFAGCEFRPPNLWSAEKLQGGLLLLDPKIEDEWQANVFLELSDETHFSSMNDTLSTLAANLKHRKPKFSELNRRIDKLPSGLVYGVIDYTCVQEPATLREWQVVIEIESDQRLFVLMSSSENGWKAHALTFQGLLDSLRKKETNKAPEPKR